MVDYAFHPSSRLVHYHQYSDFEIMYFSYCNFGIMCRLGSCHLNMSTGQNLCRVIPSTLANDEWAAATESDTVNEDESQKLKPQKLNQQSVKNILSKDTQIKLRKNQYPFICKRHFEQKSESKNVPALPPKERKLIDFRDKVYVAPLTTVGNLPFRRIMKHYGADITCGEMALADQLLMGKPSEWALLKRHPCEDVFGVQLASGHADQFTRLAEVLSNEENIDIDFVDMNLGCPIDLVCDKGAGAALMLREKKLRESLVGMLNVLNCPVTIKMRTGWNEGNPIAHELVPRIQSWNIDGVGAIMVSNYHTSRSIGTIDVISYATDIFPCDLFLRFMVEAVCSDTPDWRIGIT